MDVGKTEEECEEEPEVFMASAAPLSADWTESEGFNVSFIHRCVSANQSAALSSHRIG